MAIRARSRMAILCLRCDVPLSADERHHYGRQCHVCVIREHDLTIALARDPDHPERDWYEASPVDLARPNRMVRRARAA